MKKLVPKTLPKISSCYMSCSIQVKKVFFFKKKKSICIKFGLKLYLDVYGGFKLTRLGPVILRFNEM